VWTHFPERDGELVAVQAEGRAEGTAEEKVDGLVFSWGEGTAEGAAEEKVDGLDYSWGEGTVEEKVDGLVYSWGEGWASDSSLWSAPFHRWMSVRTQC
jgi:hypothetical protein